MKIPHTEIWKMVKANASEIWPNPVWCSLFGDVQHRMENGELVGVIPGWLADEARTNGFDVLCADFRRGAYCLKLRDQAVKSLR